MRTRQEIEERFAPTDDLASFSSFVLFGIGGAGMSGIAHMLLRRGFSVKGVDAEASQITAGLAAAGAKIAIGRPDSIASDGDAIILSDAIPLESAAVAHAVTLGCPLFRRSQALAYLLRGKKTIAVTGSHGKTTTTGMLAAGLIAAGLDPTVVVGADVPEFGGAVIEGSGEWAVVEACEAYDSLRDFEPEIAVLTNLELDHVDFHVNWDNLASAVASFLKRVPPSGAVVACDADSGVREVLAALPSGHPTIEKYGAGDFSGDMALPGSHNRLNAAGALAAAALAGADRAKAAAGIAAFRGAERRLQVLQDDSSLTVVDDYAHHPTEIDASIAALRAKYPGRRLVVVYQPHLYSRTAPLIEEFAASLSAADLVVLTDIYPAREAPIPGVSSFRIAEHITVSCKYVPSRHLLPRSVADLILPGDVVVGMGAGNIASFAPDFIREAARRSGDRPTRVAVIYGGESAEREVSILTAQSISAALVRKGYEVVSLDVTDRLMTGRPLDDLVGPLRPDVCFLAVHGTGGEDGALQGLLEMLHLPYTGSGVQASAMAMDKAKTKALLAAEGLPVPRGVRLRAGEPIPAAVPCPAVVKPNAQGSTVGLSFVQKREDLAGAVQRALQFDDTALIEEWVRGIEISVPVLGDRALPAVELVPASGSYDFASKYTPGATEEICPARISAEWAQAAERYALQAHAALGCSGVTRTDMIVHESGIVILEINTLPGMTATSIVPRSAQVAGMDFDDLADWMVKDALAKAAKA